MLDLIWSFYFFYSHLSTALSHYNCMYATNSVSEETAAGNVNRTGT